MKQSANPTGAEAGKKRKYSRKGYKPGEITEKVANITAEQVKKLAKAGMRLSEIADYFEVSLDTLRKYHLQTYKAAQADRKKRLHALQWKSAVRGSVSMQIFLGKNLLGQTDNGTSEIEDEDESEISSSEMFKKMVRSTFGSSESS